MSESRSGSLCPARTASLFLLGNRDAPRQRAAHPHVGRRQPGSLRQPVDSLETRHEDAEPVNRREVADNGERVEIEGLISAVADLLAALLRPIGIVGSPRRRAGILENLELLERLRTHEEFGPGTAAYTVLTNHVILEVGRLSGVDLRAVRKKINWSSAIVSTCIWAPLAYVVYLLDRDGFDWLSLLPAIPAGLFFVAAVGLILERKEERVSEDGAAASS